MFKDYDTALKWAAQEMHSVAYDSPSINRMRGNPSAGIQNDVLIGLSRLEKHNQAVNIVGKVIGIEDRVHVLSI